MSIGVNVNGVYHIMPGVYPVFDASELVSQQPGATGILAILGKGTGMIPPKTFYTASVNSGVLNRQLVDGSEVLQAALLAISPSGQVPGVSNLRIVLVNPATKSTYTLKDNADVNVIRLDSVGYGVYFNGITAAVDTTNHELTITLGTAISVFKYSTGQGSAAALVDLINKRSSNITATLLANGSGTLDAVSPAEPFTGGTDSSPTTRATHTLEDTTAVTPLEVITLTTIGAGTAQNAMTVAVDATGKTLTLVLGGFSEMYDYVTTAGGLQALVDDINTHSTLVTAVLNEVGSGELADLAADAFTGGLDGSPTNQDWADCFGILETAYVNLVLVVDPTEDVQLMLAAHCEKMRRIGFCGYSLQTGWTGGGRATNLTNLRTRAQTLASPNVLFEGVGTDGLASYMSVAKIAGIAAGVEPTVPLNNKDLRTIESEADLSVEEAEELLDSGVCVPFRRVNRNNPGFVVADGVSTWSGDDNLALRLISVLRGVYGVEEVITEQVQQYLGQEAQEVTLGRAVATVNRVLQAALNLDNPIRIVSYDSGATKAAFSDTVLKLYYTFTPIQPIRYVVPIASLKPTNLVVTVEIPLGI